VGRNSRCPPGHLSCLAEPSVRFRASCPLWAGSWRRGGRWAWGSRERSCRANSSEALDRPGAFSAADAGAARFVRLLTVVDGSRRRCPAGAGLYSATSDWRSPVRLCVFIWPARAQGIRGAGRGWSPGCAGIAGNCTSIDPKGGSSCPCRPVPAVATPVSNSWYP
jgi:hypothetical protein